METLAISAANLNTIENNLNVVANELSGVINNVANVNNQVNKVEAKVASLNDEVRSLVKEIRQTTIITNARQSIMYNNERIDKEFGYYSTVRRITLSLLDAVNESQMRQHFLEELRQELILKNPHYWLSCATSALISWLLDDKENCDIEVKNALKLDSKRTSIFLALCHLKFKRYKTAINWLNKYLSSQDPLAIDKDFVTIFDLVANGVFGQQAREVVLNKISEWFYRLNEIPEVKENELNTISKYITSLEESDITMPYLESKTPDINILKNNLTITSSYHNVYSQLKNILDENNTNKTIDTVIKELIYKYEEPESVYEKENFKNNLIIECNGDTNKALALYADQEKIVGEKINLIALMINIVIHKNLYQVSNETRKMALSLINHYFLEAYTIKNSKIDIKPFNLNINGFNCMTEDGTNKEEINHNLNNYLDSIFNVDDKNLLGALIIINILGIVGLFITLKSKLFMTILILLLIIGNVLLFYQLNKRQKNRQGAKMTMQKNIANELERVLAETVDYRHMLQDDMTYFEQLKQFLNDIKTADYIKNSEEERNLKIEG